MYELQTRQIETLVSIPAKTAGASNNRTSSKRNNALKLLNHFGDLTTSSKESIIKSQ